RAQPTGICIATRCSREECPSGSPCRGQKQSADRPARLRFCRSWRDSRAYHATRCAGGNDSTRYGPYAFQSYGRASAPKNDLPSLPITFVFSERCSGRYRIRYFTGVGENGQTAVLRRQASGFRKAGSCQKPETEILRLEVWKLVDGTTGAAENPDQ